MTVWLDQVFMSKSSGTDCRDPAQIVVHCAARARSVRGSFDGGPNSTSQLGIQTSSSASLAGTAAAKAVHVRSGGCDGGAPHTLPSAATPCLSSNVVASMEARAFPRWMEPSRISESKPSSSGNPRSRTERLGASMTDGVRAKPVNAFWS